MLQTVQNQPLRAGAGRAQIEFPETFFPIEGFESLHDTHYVRILLIEAGRKIVIMSVEITSIPAEIVDDFKETVHKVTGIATSDILICVTHTFSTPHFIPRQMCKSSEDLKQNETLFALYKTAIEKAAFTASSELKSALFGCEVGTCKINVNRDILTKDGWWLGCNETGSTDHTVTVIRLDDVDGKPIALLFNYAVQPSVLDGSITASGGKLLSTDLAGTASRFIEKEYEGKITAIFCIGAAADQSPSHKSKQSYLDKDGSIKTVDIHEQGTILVESLGKRLGSEVIRVSEEIHCKPLTSALKLENHLVKCPGQKIPKDIHSIKPTKKYDFRPDEDRNEPFEIVWIGDVAIICVRPELTIQTATEIKEKSPYRKTMILTMVNGGAKYMADQSAYDRITYEAMNSPFGRGSAELLRDKIIQILKN